MTLSIISTINIEHQSTSVTRTNMARYLQLLSLALTLVVVFYTCSAQIELGSSQTRQQQQRYQTQCNIQNLKAHQPQRRIQSEAGITEFWDNESDDFECANVVVVRHTIRSNGLLVPSFTNAPILVYVVQGI